MDLSDRLAISYYRTITTINDDHQIYLVQHCETNDICVKKVLQIYNADLYRHLKESPVSGTPRIIEICEEAGRLTVIEEYISGKTLQSLMDAHALSVSESIRILRMLCKTVNNLHSQTPPIIHRDIKPSNVILTSGGNPCLLDMNAAKYYSEDAQEDTMLLGTKGYAAPEQFGFGASNARTDIYALGIMLREMLTAASPSDPKLSSACQPVILRCTQLDPKDRYENVTELMHALEIILSTGEAPANASPADYTSRISKEVPTRQKSGAASYLPPGFRTRKPWKMIFAACYYLLGLTMALTMTITENNGTSETGSELLLAKVIFFLLVLTIPAALFNYRGLQRLMPLCQSENPIIRLIGILILVSVLIFLEVFVLVLVSAIITTIL